MALDRLGRERLGDDADHVVGDDRSILRCADAKQDGGKFVAADAADDVTRARRLLQPLGDHAQHVVAGLVTAQVIHLLEVVDVEIKQRAVLALALDARDRLAQLVLEIVAVVQIGDAVVERHVLKLALGKRHAFPQRQRKAVRQQEAEGDDQHDAEGVVKQAPVQRLVGHVKKQRTDAHRVLKDLFADQTGEQSRIVGDVDPGRIVRVEGLDVLGEDAVRVVLGDKKPAIGTVQGAAEDARRKADDGQNFPRRGLVVEDERRRTAGADDHRLGAQFFHQLLAIGDELVGHQQGDGDECRKPRGQHAQAL